MATWYLVTSVNTGSGILKSGKLINDAVIPTAPILSAGGLLVASSDATVAAAALVVQQMWLQGKSQDECDSVMVAAYEASIAAAGVAHDTVTAAAVVHSGYAAFYNPIAAELVTIVNDVQMATGALAIAGQPNVPCKLQVRITDAGNAVTGTLITVGVGADGAALTQTIQLTGGTRTVITADAYATLTSATLNVTAGAGGGKNIGIGVGAALGLPIPAGATSVSVSKATCDYANETVGTVDATARTVIPTTGANAAHDYEFWFRYTLSHTHAMS